MIILLIILFGYTVIGLGSLLHDWFTWVLLRSTGLYRSGEGHYLWCFYRKVSRSVSLPAVHMGGFVEFIRFI